MPLVSMRQLLDHAAENGYGIPAFNVNNLEQVQAVMSAAAEVGAPVILQASAGARKYAGEPFIKHLILAAIESWPQVPLVMHQDHGQSPDVCKGAIDLGFSSVMMDGRLEADGKTIASYDYNVDVTRKVVDMAHAQGVTVEGELGCLGSLETMRGDKEDGHGTESTMTREQLLTDPEQAADFVKRTQLDALAIAIGTSHGAYKFTRKPTGDILAIDRIKADPPAHSQHAPGDARQLQRAAGPAGRDPPVRRRHERDLRRAGRGDPGSHQAWRAQDQHRHRRAPGDDRRDPPLHGREPGQVRPARLPQAGARGGQGHLHASATCSSAAKARPARSSPQRWPRWPRPTPAASSHRRWCSPAAALRALPCERAAGSYNRAPS